ncbi:MAG: hypothetical protein IPG67_13320 [Acidobacteria bacterium]|nr:hypothetical protein [Acidobacteriota bacterium]MBK7933187.1 hypothetical protein [Acidobacteriota bacterium]
MKRVSFLLAITFFAFAAVSTFAQGGGKAEPGRVKFAKGKTSTVLTGTLSGDQEQEFVFGARKGQTIYITNPDSVRFAYRLFNDEESSESTDLAEPTMVFLVPETGDYMLFVRRADSAKRAAKFSITLAIE